MFYGDFFKKDFLKKLQTFQYFEPRHTKLQWKLHYSGRKTWKCCCTLVGAIKIFEKHAFHVTLKKLGYFKVFQTSKLKEEKNFLQKHNILFFTALSQASVVGGSIPLGIVFFPLLILWPSKSRQCFIICSLIMKVLLEWFSERVHFVLSFFDTFVCVVCVLCVYVCVVCMYGVVGMF